MTPLKVIGALSTSMMAGSVLLLQAAGATPEITGAVLLSASVLALQIYLLRRVQSIPAEEGVKRHDAIDRIGETIAAMQLRDIAEKERIEDRIMRLIREGLDREATERRTFDERLRQLEREMPPRARAS